MPDAALSHQSKRRVKARFETGFTVVAARASRCCLESVDRSNWLFDQPAVCVWLGNSLALVEAICSLLCIDACHTQTHKATVYLMGRY
jgi:hypothetical protein